MRPVRTTSPLGCSSTMYHDLESAVGVLGELSSNRAVISWWATQGQSSHNLILAATIPISDRQIACANLDDVRRVMAQALGERNVNDMEQAVSRLVSAVEEVQALYDPPHGVSMEIPPNFCR